jgi:hypothetical protein
MIEKVRMGVEDRRGCWCMLPRMNCKTFRIRRFNNTRILCFLILNEQRNGAFLLGRGKYERD